MVFYSLNSRWVDRIRRVGDEWLIYHSGNGNSYCLSGLNGLLVDLLNGHEVSLSLPRICDELSQFSGENQIQGEVERAIETLKIAQIVKVVNTLE